MSQDFHQFAQIIQETDAALELAQELEQELSQLQLRRPQPVEKAEELPGRRFSPCPHTREKTK